MQRTDTHRPSVIDPSEYDFVGQEYMRLDDLGAADVLLRERERIRAHMARTGGTYSAHQHGGACHVCGAAAVYTVLFWHRPTNSYIRTGQDCAEKLAMGDPDRFRAFREGIRSALKARAGRRKAEAVLEAAGLQAAWSIFTAGAATPDDRDHATVQDIVGKLVKYGSISEKQETFLRGLLARIADRPAIEAKRAAERAAAADCPTGRMQIRGTVVKVEAREGFRGADVLKITIRTEAGFVVWGTAPDALVCCERPAAADGGFDGYGVRKGDRVELTGTLTPSERDPKFGFFKRPTGARLLPV